MAGLKTPTFESQGFISCGVFKNPVGFLTKTPQDFLKTPQGKKPRLSKVGVFYPDLYEVGDFYPDYYKVRVYYPDSSCVGVKNPDILIVGIFTPWGFQKSCGVLVGGEVRIKNPTGKPCGIFQKIAQYSVRMADIIFFLLLLNLFSESL